MSLIGNKISETRKLKGFSQEKLAELSKINLRTIQRIENNINEPRGNTLSLICKVLELDLQELLEQENQTQRTSVVTKMVYVFILFALNAVLLFIFYFLVADYRSNFNSRLGGFLLSIFIPYFIISLTKKMTGTERILKFGLGFILCFLLSVFLIRSNFHLIYFAPCCFIILAILFYGNSILKLNK